MQEAWRGRSLSLCRAFPLGPTCLEQDVDAQDIRTQEGLRVEDGPVHMGLGGEVDDGVDPCHERGHDLRVGDVALDEAESGGLLGICLDWGEIGAVAGVGQLVDYGDVRPILAGKDVPNETRTDEARPPGDQQPAKTRQRLGHALGLVGGGVIRPAFDSCSDSSAARMSELTVPASVHKPSNLGANRLPGR